MLTVRDLMRIDAPMVVVDEEGFIKNINLEFEETFLWPASKLVGRFLTAIIPPEWRNAHHLGFSRFLATENPTLLNQDLDLKILLGNGEIRNARHYISAEKIHDQWIFCARVELTDESPSEQET